MADHDDSYKELLSSYPEFPEELIESIVNADWFRERMAAEQAALGRAFAKWLVRDFLPSRLPGVEIPQVTELEEVVAMLAERREEWASHWKQPGPVDDSTLVATDDP